MHKYFTLIFFVISQFALEVTPVFGSFLQAPIETEEGKHQKIREEINKNYKGIWNRKKRKQIQKLTLEFFAPCSEFQPEAIKHTLSSFSKCTSFKEAQSLGIEVFALSTAVQGKDSYRQALLLSYIANIDPEHRSLFLKQLKRFSQQTIQGDFHEIPIALSKLNPHQYSVMTDLILEFFENCEEIHALAVKYPFEIFSHYFSDKAQELIKVIKNLSEEVKNEKSLHQAFLLSHIAAVPSNHQALFIEQLRKFAQKNLEGDFYKISAHLIKLQPEHFVPMTDYILELFENCSTIDSRAIEYPVEVFSKCASLENIKKLIKMTQSLAKAGKNETSIAQSTLLKHIAQTDSVNRKNACKHLLRIANHFKEGSYWFYQVCQEFLALPPSQYEWVANQIIRFSALKQNSQELDCGKARKIIQVFRNMPLETQSLFSIFIEENKVTNLKWAKKLSQQTPENWGIILWKLQNKQALKSLSLTEVNT